MEEQLKLAFNDTMSLIKRYGICLLKDPTVTRKELKDLSAHMMFICDESLRQDATFKRTKTFKQEIFPGLIDPDNVEDESVIFQFQNDLENTYSGLDLGKKNSNYKDFEEAVLNKVPKRKVQPEVAAVSQNVNLVDPITKRRLVNPVRNSTCGHVYEKSTIMQLLNKKKINKCPIPGCVATAKLTKKDLAPDAALKRFLQKKA